jgi:tetratricopeptide (TPR) repeat protein
MRSEAKVCSCGAKNHQKWKRCQRCGAELVTPSRATKAANVETEPSRLLSGWLIAAGVAVLVIGAAIGLPRRTPETAAPAKTTRPAAPGAPVAAASGADPRANVPALAAGTASDLDREAASAYARRDFKGALDALRRAVAADPSDLVAQNNLGQVLVRLGQAPEAIPHLTIAANGAPGEWSYHFNLARARGQAGDWSGAVESYQAADQLFPNDHVTLFNLAQALQKANRQDDALPVLEKVIAAAPEDPSFLVSLASAYEQAGRSADAAETFSKYLEKAPSAPDAGTVKAHLARLQGAATAPQSPAVAPVSTDAMPVAPATESAPAPPSQ